jgi:hypothetical protein
MTPTLQEPTLLIRIYCKNTLDEVRTFAERMAALLGLAASDGDGASWSAEDGNADLALKDADTGDTVMLDCVASGSAFDGFWPSALARLWDAYEQARGEGDGPNVLGRSVVYHAVANAETLLEALWSDAVLAQAGLPRTGLSVSQEIPGGRLWLVKVPVFREDRDLKGEPKTGYHIALTSPGGENGDLEDEPITVRYIALATPDGESSQAEYLWGLPFFRPDLYTHKAYTIAHNYRHLLQRLGVEDEQGVRGIDPLLNELRDEIKNVIGARDVLSKRVADELDDLARHYERLLEASLKLQEMYTSLRQQRWSFDYHFQQSPQGEVWEWHRRRIESYYQEIEIKSEQCRNTLEAANQAVHIAEARIERLKEARRQRQEDLITFIGLVFAVPQLVTDEMLARVVSQFEWGWGATAILVAPRALTLALVVLIWLAIRWFAHRSKRV